MIIKSDLKDLLNTLDIKDKFINSNQHLIDKIKEDLLIYSNSYIEIKR